MPAKIYYERDREHHLQQSKDYYTYNKEHVLRKLKDKYHNMPPEKRLKMQEYKKIYQKIYLEKKKKEHSNFNKNAVLVP